MFTIKTQSPFAERLLIIALSCAFVLLIGLPFFIHYKEVNHLERVLSAKSIAEKEKKLTEIQAILSNINYQQNLANISRAQNTDMSGQETYSTSPFNQLENKITRLKEKKAQLKETLATQEQQIETLIKQIEELKQNKPSEHLNPA